jgi:hypothetical protein
MWSRYRNKPKVFHSPFEKISENQRVSFVGITFDYLEFFYTQKQ